MKMEVETKEVEQVAKEVTNQIIQNDVNDVNEKDTQSEERVDNAKKYNNYELNTKKKKNKNKKKIAIISSIIILVAIILIALSCTIFALINSNSDKIIEGVSINGFEISGLTKEEAKEKIEKICNEKLQNEINVKYEEYESKINLTLLEAKYDIDKAIEEAFNIGRSGNIIQNNFAILSSKNNNINLEVSLNEEDAINILNDISANIPGYVKESSYYLEDDKLIITKGKDGIAVDSDALLKIIYEDLSNITVNQGYITIPVKQAKPGAIDIDKIYEEIHKEAKDAYYTKDPFTIYPEVNGVDFDLESARELLKEEKQEYEIKLKITKPNKTINNIGTEAFPDELSKCSTKYKESDKGRTTNLKLAASKINGTVLMPGEEFSYNKTVGERTIEAGYKEAPIFSNGSVIPGLGGGICQISSTLYDAVVFANLDVTVRRNHQFVTSYIEAGKDATVVWGSQDFKFKNTRQYPIRIVASVNGGVATVSIYGIKEDTEYDISIETKYISTISYGTIYREAHTLAAGTEKVEQNGVNGRVVEAYKVTKLNGKVVSRTLLSKDTYNAKQKIVLRGTAVKTPTTPTTPTPITTTPTEPTTPTTPTTTPDPTTPSNNPSTSTQKPTESEGTQTTPEGTTQPSESTEGRN